MPGSRCRAACAGPYQLRCDTGKSMSPVSPETIQLWGGALCIDFVNTVDYDADDRPLVAHEALVGPRDLARWARRLGITRGRRLLRVDPAEHAAALALPASLSARP